jgi:hypothetical protein
MFEKVKKKYAICIRCVSLTDFPEPSSIILNLTTRKMHRNKDDVISNLGKRAVTDINTQRDQNSLLAKVAIETK